MKTYVPVEQSMAEIVALVARYGYGTPTYERNRFSSRLMFAGVELRFKEPGNDVDRRQFWRGLKRVVHGKLEEIRIGVDVGAVSISDRIFADTVELDRVAARPQLAAAERIDAAALPPASGLSKLARKTLRLSAEYLQKKITDKTGR